MLICRSGQIILSNNIQNSADRNVMPVVSMPPGQMGPVMGNMIVQAVPGITTMASGLALSAGQQVQVFLILRNPIIIIIFFLCRVKSCNLFLKCFFFLFIGSTHCSTSITHATKFKTRRNGKQNGRDRGTGNGIIRTTE